MHLDDVLTELVEIGALLGCREASVRSLARRGLAAMRPLAAAASAEEDRT